MSRLIAALSVMLFTGIAVLALFGCNRPGPFVREGNANSVEIGYSGDVSNAMPLARRHCAQFERLPRLVNTTFDGALFDCLRPEGS